MDGRMDEQKNEWTNESINEWMNEWMNEKFLALSRADCVEFNLPKLDININN